MKKTNFKFGLIFFFAFIGISFVSCSGTKDVNGKYYNKAYNAKEMVNIAGEKTILTDNKYTINNEEQGFAFVIPESLQPRFDQNLFSAMVDNGYAIFINYSQAAMDMINNFNAEGITEEDYYNFLNEVDKKIFTFGILYHLPLNDPRGPDSDFLEYVNSVYAQTSEIARLTDNGTEYVYYFAWNTDLSNYGATDEEIAEMQRLIDSKDDFVNSIMVFPPATAQTEATSQSQPSSDSVKGDLSILNTTDLDGNVVTEDIFKDYDLTMINIWATWCGPCLSEIPELGKLQGMLPDNAQLISICTDADTAKDDAKEILKTSNASYLTLLPTQELATSFLSTVTAVPTTVFVDSEGKLVGDPVVGVPGSDAANAYLQKINALLAE